MAWLTYHASGGKKKVFPLKPSSRRFFWKIAESARGRRGCVLVFPAASDRTGPPAPFLCEHQVSIVEHTALPLTSRLLHWFARLRCFGQSTRYLVKHNGLSDDVRKPFFFALPQFSHGQGAWGDYSTSLPCQPAAKASSSRTA